MDTDALFTMKSGSGRTSGSLSTLPKATLEFAATALSTRVKSWAMRRSPEPMRRSSRDLGDVSDRIGMEVARDSRGSQKLLLLVLVLGEKVSPLRSDMFCRLSIRLQGSFRAGLLRGWLEVDMLSGGIEAMYRWRGRSEGAEGRSPGEG